MNIKGTYEFLDSSNNAVAEMMMGTIGELTATEGSPFEFKASNMTVRSSRVLKITMDAESMIILTKSGSEYLFQEAKA